MIEATQFQAFRDTDGKYRWRLLDSRGEIVPIKIGSISLPRSRDDARIERAVDGALERIARRQANSIGN